MIGRLVILRLSHKIAARVSLASHAEVLRLVTRGRLELASQVSKQFITWHSGHACFEFAGFRKQKLYGLVHGNGPYGEIRTKKEPIRTLGFLSRLPCHKINPFIQISSVIRNSQQKIQWNICYTIRLSMKDRDHNLDVR